ncbi:DevR family CRISPR-associated autoregulator [Ferroacidibacillus organovorans]|uniref:Type I-B CRISPR-associated protein Cas7/Cst2/DevR n=1 Tax=Ferroacidibacillus organovorans TaxID=1765683 RepID=A0A1V4EY31_9BACL|nr:DevR family CRISPR-associated autoregulator [Ferroacidibacillus organovorans]OPG17664.1 type I-B CRISPR-associated protein Cas7/Cst2/DevR [Ferroacidibacillus organovorans]
MSLHIHGTVVTQYGVAANNRGETEGNTTTLQKILWHGLNHTTVSAEAIRYAIRLNWQRRFEDGDASCETNRVWLADKGAVGDFEIKDQAFSADRYIDDDVMGYMEAKAAKTDNSDQDGEIARPTRGKAGKAPKGTTTARRGPLEVTRAVSLDPYNGEVTFNAKGGDKGRTSLYATEIHATRYQYSFTLTPAELKVQERAIKVVDAVATLHDVGGNHGRFLYDFSPSLVIFRITQDPAPRILYVAEPDLQGEVSIETLLQRVKSGDLSPQELFVGGEAIKSGEAVELRELGVNVYPGVRKVFEHVIQQLQG